MGISIIVCCYNSSSRLLPTLTHLAELHIPEHTPVELILVDNASTDGTTQRAGEIWRSLNTPIPIIIVQEAKQGLAFAKKAGLAKAGYRYFVFCDDDNWLNTDYLTTGLAFLQSHPDIGLVGGVAEAVADIALPDWFKGVEGYYSVGGPAQQTTDLSHYGIWGAGMMGLTQPMQRTIPAGIPLLSTGRLGNSQEMGEDGEMCMRMVMQGFRVYFNTELKLKHYMSAHRLNATYRDSLLKSSERPAAIMGSYFRYIHYSRLSFLGKRVKVMIHLLRYALAIFSGKQKQLTFSRDFIFFGTGWKSFSSDVSRVIQQYAAHIRDEKWQMQRHA